MLLNLVDEHLLHFSWSNLLGTLESAVPFLTLNVGFNCFLKISYCFVDLSSRIKLADLKHSRTEDKNNILDSILGIVHCQVEAVVINLLKMLWAEHCLSDLQVSVDGLVVISGFLPHLGRVEDLVWRLVLSGWTSRIVLIDLMDEMWSVLVGDTESLTKHFSLLIHVDSLFWLLSINIGLFSLGKISSLQVEFGLVDEDLIDTLWVVLSCDREGGVPILLVLVHVDGFLWLVGLDELFFGFFEPILVLKVQSIFEMYLRKLVLGVVVGKSECIIKSLLIGLKVDGGFDKAILNEKLSSFLAFHVLGNLDSDLSKLLLVTIGLGNSKSIFPHLMGSVHIHADLPGTSFDVMVLSLLQVTLDI